MLWTIAGMVLLLVTLILLIRLPAVQHYITQKATRYLASKTHTRITLDRLYIGFPKSVVVEGLFAEDLQHDTLLSLHSLEVDIELPALLRHKVNVNKITLAGLNTHIKRSLRDSSFNFDFFIRAFAGDSKNEPADTAGSPWEIHVQTIELENIRASLQDEVSGTDLHASLEKLKLDLNSTDLQAMRFDVDELELSGAALHLVQNKETPDDTDTTATLLPDIAIGRVRLQQVQCLFENSISGEQYRFTVGKMLLRPGHTDLNRQQLSIRELQLEESSAAIAMKQHDGKPAQTGKAPAASASTPGWQVDAEKISCSEVSFRLDMTDVPRQAHGMDYSHLHISHAALDIRNASYNSNTIRADVRNISLQEQCGLDLRQLQAKVEYDDRHAEL